MCPICRKPLASDRATTCSPKCRQELFRRRNAERADAIKAATRDLGTALAGKDLDAAAKHHRELSRHVRDLVHSR